MPYTGPDPRTGWSSDRPPIVRPPERGTDGTLHAQRVRDERRLDEGAGAGSVWAQTAEQKRTAMLRALTGRS